MQHKENLSSEEKRALLLKRLQKLAQMTDEYPISPFQEGILFETYMYGQRYSYNLQRFMHLRGILDQEALEKSINEIVKRHIPLRTLFPLTKEGTFQQFVKPFEYQKMAVTDLRSCSSEQREKRALHLIQQEGRYTFNLKDEFSFRTHLVQLGDDEYMLLCVIYHLVFDLSSFEIFFAELAHCYQAFVAGRNPQLPPLAASYKQFVAWQEQHLQQNAWSAQAAYWQQQLGGTLPVLALPTDHPHPGVFSDRGAFFTRPVAGVECAAMKSFAQRNGCTLFHFLLAVFVILLVRYTGQEDLLIGTPMTRRDRVEWKKLIGLFVNTVVLRVDAAGNPTFRQLLERIREIVLDAYMHSDLPFAKVVQHVQPERSTLHSAFYQAMFTVENEVQPLQLPGLTIDPFDMDQKTTFCDLYLILQETRQGIHARFEYNTDIFEIETIQRISKHFECLLQCVMHNPDIPFSRLSFLTEDEMFLLLHRNQTVVDLPSSSTLPVLFERQVERTPHSRALTYKGQHLSYEELNARANQLAHYLHTVGVQPEVVVAVGLERSPDMLIALLGVLKAGGAYLPLDPASLPQRRAFLLNDARVAVLLTHHALLSGFQPYLGLVVCLDRDRSLLASQPTTNLAHPSTQDHLAYIISTCGSSGTPKGVQIFHRALVNFLLSMQQELHMTRQDRFLALTTLSSDIAGLELYAPLLSGACVVLVSREDALDGSALVSVLEQEGITLMQATAMTWRLLLKAGWTGDPALRLLCGGEAWSLELARQLGRRGRAVYNLYGSTETTIWSTCCQITPDQAVLSIGHSLARTTAYVLDPHDQFVACGVIGELCIGGVGLARGYVGRADLTAERFVPDPWSQEAGARLYRTGDLARYHADGSIEVPGRIDQQMKRLGLRIEPGEIEAALEQRPEVQECAVALKEVHPRDQRLVAYIVKRTKGLLEVQKLRDQLAYQLPEYMIPDQFIEVEALPVTGNGKLHRKALPDLESRTRMRAHGSDAPHVDLEKRITAIWQDLLENPMVGLYDNFFELGGHSGLLARMRQQLYQEIHEDLSPVDLLRYATVHALVQHIEKRKEMKILQKEAKPESAGAMPLSGGQQTGPDIAVIGMDVRLPGAQTIEEFWQNLRDGVESICWFSRAELKESGVSVEELNDPQYVPAKGFLAGADLFDAAFFGITPREAELLDPQQRLFLECAWQALEYAGYNPENYTQRIGLYAGASFNTYLFYNIALNQDYVRKVGLFQVLTTNDKDFLATRVAYKLHLTGPAVTVQTACSTGLVAVHQACQSLLNHECEIALAGGSSIHSPLKDGYLYREGEISSPDGRCRAFDAQAKGTVAGDGVGVVVLKRLSDALQDGDTIYAVIKGSAINNDGALKAGYTAPSVDGQAHVIRNALSVAGAHPDTISYIEAHGTGTPLGDPIEVEGLIEAFRASGSQREGFCALGSVKTNFGHLDAAAGIVGLIKVILSLQHQQLFPSLHFEQANPLINFAHSPFFVNTTLTPWHSQTGPRRAGVSSFGIGGTNAHAIVEEAPAQPPSGPSKQWQLLLLSARSSSALATLTDTLQRYIRQHCDVHLADVAYTLQVGRKAFPYRRMLVCQSIEEALQGLEETEQAAQSGGKTLDQRSVVFLFPGQGSQYVGMASDLYTDEQIFHEQVDACLQILKEREGLDLRPILLPHGHEVQTAEQLHETAITQPALFVIEYALAQLWISWGVQPQAMLGHSIGEYVAACLAGVFSLADALSIVAERGRLIQSCARGAMLSVSLSESKVLSLLHTHEHLSLAAINGPDSVVVAGPDEEIQVLKASLDAQEVNNRLLHTSHAFHSGMMEGILAPFEAKVRAFSLKRPGLPFISNVTGTWITEEEATDPCYWVKHVRSTVRFADGLQHMLLEDKNLFLEVGPGKTLSTLVKQHPAKGVQTRALSSLSHPQARQHDRRTLLQAAGSLWLAGVSLDWQRFCGDEKRRRIALPTYPFERQRYWIEMPRDQRGTSEQLSSLKLNTILPEQLGSDESVSTIVEAANELEELVAGVWQEVLGVHPLSVTKDFFELGGDSLMASRVINETRKNLDLPLTLGSFFDAPTVRDFAKYLEKLMTEQLDSPE
jgi:amino acid adenylation domain-containing protein